MALDFADDTRVNAVAVARGQVDIQPMKLLRVRYRTVDEHRELFTAAGCIGVTIDAERRKGWIGAVWPRRPMVLAS